MRKTNRQLGMDSEITRRDFIHDLSLGALAITLPLSSVASQSPHPAPPLVAADYPPIRTGMRGSHPGAFEAAHAMAREGQSFSDPESLDEDYDLVVVGGGISGLAAAYYYRRKFGADARILILENHDDFGGHAKRNEFHQGGQMRLSWGGTMNLEYPEFSDSVNALLEELGVDLKAVVADGTFRYGSGPKGSSFLFFDEETFGRNELISDFGFRSNPNGDVDAKIDNFPVSDASRASLKAFYAKRENILADKSESEADRFLSSISFTDFLKTYGGLTDEAADLFIRSTHGYWGIGADSLSVAECVDAGLPIMHLLGSDRWSGINSDDVGGEVAMFPDGNATIARLLVHSLVPQVAPGSDAENIALASFNYAELDNADHSVRIRLQSTAVKVQNDGKGTAVTYLRGGQLSRVKSKHAVLACYHSVIPHICPELSTEQRQAQKLQVKRPLILTNVLLRNSKAMDSIGISGAYCPGRLHGMLWQVKGVSTAGYKHDWNDDSAVPVMFWGSVAPPDSSVHPREQHRASRALLLGMSFADFEREVRTVLDGMLGEAGFDVENDILAITVNRWPHGYSYDYLDLWDPKWPAGEAPHELARQRQGNIAIANSDAGADAYTHVAIDEALRAISDLS